MKLVDKLQTLEKEDARKVVFEELGKRAIDMLNEIKLENKKVQEVTDKE